MLTNVHCGHCEGRDWLSLANQIAASCVLKHAEQVTALAVNVTNHLCVCVCVCVCD